MNSNIKKRRGTRKMPYTIRLADPKCKFSASHFLYQHEKCSRLHGHNYSIDVEITGELNENFFVIDFFVLKKAVLEIADELDHAILIPKESETMQISEHGTQLKIDFNGKHYEFPKSDVRLLPIKATTAELLAKFIHDRLKKTFPQFHMKIFVAESEGSTAIYQE